MALELTQAIGVMMFAYVVAFSFQIYMMYLNWKQSKVKDISTDLLKEMKRMNEQLFITNSLIAAIKEREEK